MKREIDIDKLLEETSNLPPSPRDPKITALGIASITAYIFGAYCAWQIGDWWGIGIVLSILAVNTFDGFVHQEHRDELIELHGKLVRRIAENTNIMDDVIPTENKNGSHNDP